MDWQTFNKKLEGLRYSTEDRAFIEHAFNFAKNAHAGQKRDSGDPYFLHVAATAATIADMKLDAKTVAAGLLHDTLEDCAVTHDVLEREFGNEVAFLVEGVTNLGAVRYQGIQRKVESLRKMFLAVAKDVRVVLIKLADRLHNMQTIQYIQPDKKKRIAIETLEIYAPIAYRLGMGSIKGKLEDLAFPIVHPREYAWTVREYNRRVPESEHYLRDQVKPSLEEMLNAENVRPLLMDFRKKHLYSLWKKLLRYDMDFARITDLLAMRVVVGTIEDCYQTFGVIHQLWKPLPGRIKDYIALPKSNGYRSIHTTVFCMENKITEFQIRTQSMHEEAERGIVAHWAYAETGKPKQGSSVDRRMAWVQKLSDWQKEMGSLKDDAFLESLKIDFFKDRIFMLTPKGEVIDLPQGATPIDFAYAIHTDIGNHMIGAKINGKIAPFDRELTSGETVEILTQKNKKTNPAWLSLVKTSIAKNRIRAAIRNDPYLLPQVATTLHRGQKTLYHFNITARDRVGLLKDVSAIFSAYRVNIKNITINDKNRAYPDIVLTADLRDRKQAESIATRVKSIHGVEEVGFKQ